MRRCPKCQQDRLITEFHWANKAKGIRERRCKHCWQEYYQVNKAELRVKLNARLETLARENKQHHRDYLLQHPCVDCAESDPDVLSCDHVYGQKRLSIVDMIRRGKTWKTIEAELNKCAVRCENCHARKTAVERRSWRVTGPRTERQYLLLQWLLLHPCQGCGEMDIVVLDCDHVLPGKTATVSTLVANGSLERLQQELLLCESSCRNCHKRRTAVQLGYWYVRSATPACEARSV